MVDEDSLRGVTSNPAIFEKAILGSPDYDERARRAGPRGAVARARSTAGMAVKDVQLAADVLRPRLRRDRRRRRLRLARGRAAARARHRGHARAGARVLGPGRPPQPDDQDPGAPTRASRRSRRRSTRASTSTSRCCSRSSYYERVMEAYIRGDGAPPRPRASRSTATPSPRSSSRASTPRSTSGSRRSAAPTSPAAPGSPTPAPPTWRSRSVFDGERFAELREAGARSSARCGRRPGVKNPHYPETMYVYGLVGPDTVNTMPLPTLTGRARERRDHRRHRGRRTRRRDLDALREAGIDMDDVTDKLLRDGIEAFLVPMAKLLDGIELKREAIVTGRPATIEADLPAELEQAVAERVKKAADEDVVHRIWQRDGTLWAPGGHARGRPTASAGSTIAEKLLEDVDDLDGVRRRGARRRATPTPCCSAWAARASRPRCSGARTAGHGALQPARARLDATRRRSRPSSDALDLDKTLFIVSSKSGGTIETMSQFKLLPRAASRDGAHFVAVTDPGTSLAKLGAEHGFRRVFENDPEIGGRYSALSYFGLVPAALIGVDIRAVLEGAAGRRAELPARQRGQRRPVARPRARRARARTAATSSTFVVDDAARPRSASGPSSSSPSRPASRAAASCRSPTSRSVDPGAYGADRVFVHIATGDADRRGARRGGSRKAGHPTITVNAEGAGRPRPDLLLLRVRDRGRRLGAGDQPVRPAQRAGGEGQHEPRARSEGAPDARAGRASTSCSTASRRRATSRSWATCRTASEIDEAVARAARAS